MRQPISAPEVTGHGALARPITPLSLCSFPIRWLYFPCYVSYWCPVIRCLHRSVQKGGAKRTIFTNVLPFINTSHPESRILPRFASLFYLSIPRNIFRVQVVKDRDSSEREERKTAVARLVDSVGDVLNSLASQLLALSDLSVALSGSSRASQYELATARNRV